MNRAEPKKIHAVIADEFQKRKQGNPSYSMRAFARKLGLNPTSLSQLLAQKRTLSVRNG